MAKSAIENITGKASDFTDEQKKLMLLQDFKEIVLKIHSLPECTKTTRTQLSRCYNDLHVKLNQGKLL